MTNIRKDAYFMLKPHVTDSTPRVYCNEIDTSYAVKAANNGAVGYSITVIYVTTTAVGVPLICKGYIDPVYLRPATEKEKRRSKYVMRKYRDLLDPQTPQPRRAASKAAKRKRKGWG